MLLSHRKKNKVDICETDVAVYYYSFLRALGLLHFDIDILVQILLQETK